jgi:hypothetical protein
MPNIYEEAKQELIEIETYLEHSLDHIAKALERAKKVEELLGLYRKAHIDVLNGELAYQIEALEEELK